MSKLGVTAALSFPLPCPDGPCSILFEDTMINFPAFLRDLGRADAESQSLLQQKQALRADEIAASLVVLQISDDDRVIEGEVIQDTDGDGVGDEPLAGVVVVLLTAEREIVARTVTDSTGAFAFEGLDPAQVGKNFFVVLESNLTPTPTPTSASQKPPVPPGQEEPKPDPTSSTPSIVPAGFAPPEPIEATVDLTGSSRQQVTLVV